MHEADSGLNITGNPYLLPTNVKPTEYGIVLEPNFDHLTFSGAEAILLNVLEPTQCITLHALNLLVHNVQVSDTSDAFEKEPVGKKVAAMTYDEKFQTISIHLDEPLEPGNAYVFLEFAGALQDNMRGLYVWHDEEGRAGLATQFEPTDARRMIPCFDQPNMKATFQLSVVVPKELQAFSNMPGEKHVDLESNKLVLFPPTPPISSYLLFFAVGNLECTEKVDSDGTPIRAWTTPGEKEKGRFAVDVACNTLPYYANEVFKRKCFVPKMDMFGFPEFEAGAMENPGAVAYRATALLIDPKNDSVSARKRVAEVVMHEFAHMWFGDEVTMEWWDDLWLNEAFATYMADVARAKFFPQWNIWESFLVNNLFRAFKEDSLRATKPIQVPLQSPGEINENFGAMAYSKGSAVLRMIEDVVSTPVFFAGVQRYLARHSLGNAKTKDLWQALEEESGMPIGNIMPCFTEQAGCPVVIVERAPFGDNKRSSLIMVQERFLSDGSTDSTQWNIPIRYSTQSQKTADVFFLKNKYDASLVVSARDDEWIKLNPGQTGYYRVLYDDAMQQQLHKATECHEISDIDALGLLNDLTVLASAGYKETAEALDALRYYTNRKNPNIWMVIAMFLSNVKNITTQRLELIEHEEAFGVFARRTLRPMAESLGWDARPEDSDLDKELRATLIETMGLFGDRKTIAEAQRRFNNMIAGGASFDANLHQAVYRIVANSMGMEGFEKLVALYRANEKDAREREWILRALGKLTDPEAVAKALEFSTSREVKDQDAWFPIVSFGANIQVWEFIKKHWVMYEQRFGEGMTLGRIAEFPASNFATSEMERDVKEFFQSHVVESAKRAMKRAVEAIRANVEWARRDSENLSRWLAKQK